MDPNTTLLQARVALGRVRELAEADDLAASTGEPIDVEEELHEAIEAALNHYVELDEWLTRGGFLPTSWERAALPSSSPGSAPA